ncbi:uncharacterized protein N7459_007372 [Penicillium hispanicum]|uniref:uncharacterized protein n=1 Tax=Penicillium hispanicum TaxID=1080232 RepID=UPI00254106D1|nr:uncharacterized protein N7459_007372 [Penicillium hispanicum]KAJ5578408.1 hypothetical protein N7459_007372 [Penicillium hispanicum]
MTTISLATRALFSPKPPPYESRDDINPTLMMCWWATAFSMAVIIVRLCGRYVRIERFFREDKVMMLSMIPLTIRMILVHFVLIWGTNNVQTLGLTQDEISKREIGSKLVLASRIFYTIFIWTAKLTVCEFLKRMTGVVWRRAVSISLHIIHFFLISTLIAIVIATLAECHPVDHYWQVIPDPGPRCRSGYAQLITMGVCDVITDLLLIAFPVPIILTAQMPLKRKLGLVALFCLSAVLIAITCYRVPKVIEHEGAQPYRSLIASLEILAATAVSNIVVIGSFVRDRGVKKLKWKRDQASASVSESMDNSYMRRNTVMQNQWGSDSDLAAGLGIRLDPKVYNIGPNQSYALETVSHAPPLMSLASARTGTLDTSWSFHQGQTPEGDQVSANDSLDVKVSPHELLPTNQSPREKPHHTTASSTLSSRRVSFFDVGGLLDQDSSDTHTHPAPTTPSRISPNTNGAQRDQSSSRAFLEDLGVLAPRATAPPQSRFSSPPTETTVNSRESSHTLPPYRASSDVSLDVDVELQDVGGLLSRRHHNV